MPTKSERRKIYSRIQDDMQGILKKVMQDASDEEAGTVQLDEMMQGMVGVINFTEVMHASVVTASIISALLVARDLDKAGNKEERDLCIDGTKHLYAQCLIDFQARLEEKFRADIKKLELEDLWDSNASHNEQLANELLRELEANKVSDGNPDDTNLIEFHTG